MENKQLVCKLCNKRYGSDQQFFLDEHIRRHLGEKHFKCPCCPKLFVSKTEVYSHLKTHPEQQYRFEENHECQFCFVKFQWQSGLTGHLKGVLHQQEKPYWCKFCGKLFFAKNEILEHLTTHANKTANAGDVLPLCHVCNIELNNFHKFIKHFIQFHRDLLCGPFSCEICGKSFKCLKLRSRHKTVVHDKEARAAKAAKFSCTICNRKFQSQPDLKRHGLTHTGEKFHQCQFCGKKFGLKGSLTLHERTHTKELPFDCTICEKRFNTPGQLSNHIRLHTKENPYKCEICSENFRTREGLRSHRLKSHFDKLTVYKCSKCENCFAAEESLKRHQNRFHKMTSNSTGN